MIIALTLLFLLVLIPLIILFIWSPGKPVPFVDEKGMRIPGSISEKIFIEINGLSQGMFIKSKNENNPVLLFIHGGPGMPEYWLNQRYPTGLENEFTVCWWEQRGAGLSFRRDIAPETMTVDQLISDSIEVSKYLISRFKKEKIYLLCHSNGTFFGIQAAARAPELFHAYIGVSQISHQIKSEMAAYEYMLKRFKENGNVRMLRKLENAPVTMRVPLPSAYDSLRDEAMHSLGVGTTHDMRSVISGIFLPTWQFPEYTLTEKINLWRGKLFSRRSALWDEMLAADMIQLVPELSIPAYFCHGIYDYTINYPISKQYFERINAPGKGFYTFDHSAHSPMFEEPERMRCILREDVLNGRFSLADK